MLKLKGAALVAAGPPKPAPLIPPKPKAELLAAPNAGVDAPKAGVLKPENSDELAPGWLCRGALALAKLKAEEEAPKRPAGTCA